METKDDKTIWLRNSVGNLSGLVKAEASRSGSKGWLTIMAQPLAITLEMTAGEMRALAAELESAAADIEIRNTAAA